MVLTVLLGAEATLKRFWKSVDIATLSPGSGRGPELAVTLDNRPLKTPSGSPLVIPKDRMLAASLIAAEWDNQESLLKQHSLPMVRATFETVEFAFDPAL